MYLPKLDFEFVEVNQAAPIEKERETNIEADERGEEEEVDDEQFAFPLFGGMSKSTEIMTVTLKDDEEEIKNERPESYYRVSYTAEEKSAFEQAALTAEQIFRELSLPPIDAWPLKVMSIERHNAQVEREKKKKKRAGKKKRENMVECRERRQKREKERKNPAAEKYKKKFWVGKPKGKKAKGQLIAKSDKPKFRTEAPKFRTE